MIDRTTRLSRGYTSPTLSPRREVVGRVGGLFCRGMVEPAPAWGGGYTPPPHVGGSRGARWAVTGAGYAAPPQWRRVGEVFVGIGLRRGGELRWESPALYKGAGRLVGMWWWGEARGGGRNRGNHEVGDPAPIWGAGRPPPAGEGSLYKRSIHDFCKQKFSHMNSDAES